MKCFEIVSENSKENNEECWKVAQYIQNLIFICILQK